MHTEPFEQTLVGPAAPPPPPEVPLPEDPVELPERIELADSFRYTHEPLVDDDGPFPFLAERDVIDGLKDRIRHSTGGSFLVTGFRGAGKTTVVLRTLQEVEDMEPETLDYLPVVLSVARPVSLEQLLFEVVRRLFEALTDKQILEALAPDVRRALVMAYMRTSLSFKETRSKTTEHAQSLGVGLDAVPLMKTLAPTLGLSRKRTDSMATEASFLAYSHGDVEHDFLRILDLLNQPQPPPLSRWRRALWRLRGAGRKPWQGRVVVVLDELDKLTGEEGERTVTELLSGLKNVLTTRHVHFIFVGGPELHDASILDASRGNSIYESVFAHQMYLPCLWTGSESLLNAVLKPGAITDEQKAVVQDFLDYKARGIPRLLIQKLQELVRWDGDSAFLEIDEATASRISFYARLQRIVDEFVSRPEDEDRFSLDIDRDRWRLGAYYIVDFMLRRRHGEFAVSDIVALEDGSVGEWLQRASPAKVQELVDHLVRHGVIRVARDPESGARIPDAPQERTYEITPAVRRQLSLLARENVHERGDLLAPPAPAPAGGSEVMPAAAAAPVPWSDTDELGTVQRGRYELQEPIGRGGMGTVYRARDLILFRDVAVKLLDASYFVNDDTARARFRREAEVAAQLSHPDIVATYDVFEEPDGRLGIAMELVEGDSLRKRLPLPADEAVAVAAHLLEGLAYLAERGMARIDLKPENVIIRPDGRPVIIDLGLVKPIARKEGRFDTMEGLAVGTPAYMSPEQAQGHTVDIRSDIHALGLVLFEMLSGEQAYTGETPVAVMFNVMYEEVDTSRLNVSAELKQVVARATAHEPGERFQTPLEMREALLATPEATRAST